MDPLIITVAGVGAELTRQEQPNLPVSADEIADDARECEAAGASIYHLHVRDREGNPTMEVDEFRAAVEAIAAESDLIVQFTSGGGVKDDANARIAPLELQPEMASLTTGTVNFGDYVFFNPPWLITALYRRMREHSILPEFEIFEPGMIATAERIYADHGDGHHRHFDFVLGVPGAMPAWDDSVEFLARHLPDGATWSATGVGAAHLRVATDAIRRGGHVRTGFEDVRWFEKGVLASSNAQLVGRVADIAGRDGRAVATPAEAREILDLKR
ncbi:MAG TPA: 3-keto-5-aminohexanoate cleavage protein [Actinomycetota bacterium]|nr:3-keto-5-aminohexanoate cleavage protein [Actinomycetota bacterium]